MLELDLNSDESMSQAVKEIEEEDRRVVGHDVLVNNVSPASSQVVH